MKLNSPGFREYAMTKGVEIVGKIKMYYDTYGLNCKQRYFEDDAGTRYYPDADHPTLILSNGRIL